MGFSSGKNIYPMLDTVPVFSSFFSSVIASRLSSGDLEISTLWMSLNKILLNPLEFIIFYRSCRAVSLSRRDAE